MLSAPPTPTLVFTAWTGSDDQERSGDEEEQYQGEHDEGSEDEEGEEGPFEEEDTIWDRKLAAALESNGAKEFVLQQEL